MQKRTAHLARGSTVLIAAAALSTAVVAPAEAAGNSAPGCRSVRPQSDFYAAGRVASEMLTVPASARCTTIAVRSVIDPADPADHCATFLIGFFPAEGEAEYTEPVRACSTGRDVVLATAVPDGVTYRVLYEIDYLGQSLRYTIRH